jgi:hypothetical protein
MRCRNQQAGSGLIQAIMATCILGLIGAGYMNLQQTSIRSYSKIEQKEDLTAIKRALRSKVDCNETLTGTTCSSGNFFPLKDKSGRLVGAAGNSQNDWKLGKWNFRTSCDGNRMNVQVARLKPSSSSEFMRDPLTMADQSWTDLFIPGDFDCASFFGSPSGRTCANANQAMVGIAADGLPICKTITTSCRVAIGTGTIGQSQATCAAGEFLSGGGVLCGTVASIPSATLATSFINRPNAWDDFTGGTARSWVGDCVLGYNPSSAANDWSTAFAICCKSDFQ